MEETLGKNGVTSNYRYDLAPYTWSLVRSLKSGTALFTQPPLPIKCAGAPQKAMYLSCDYWLRNKRLKNIDVEFNSAGAALFGVAAFVPPLMKYVRRYNISLIFDSNLVKVDATRRSAYFDVKDADGKVRRVEKHFDMLHVVPPQVAPDFVRHSSLADATGWCEVNQTTLQHPRYPNIFSLGDVCSSPNAKTAAAVRKQIVVVAENLVMDLARVIERISHDAALPQFTTPGFQHLRLTDLARSGRESGSILIVEPVLDPNSDTAVIDMHEFHSIYDACVDENDPEQHDAHDRLAEHQTIDEWR